MTLRQSKKILAQADLGELDYRSSMVRQAWRRFRATASMRATAGHVRELLRIVREARPGARVAVIQGAR